MKKILNGKKGAIFFYFLALILLFMIGYSIIFMNKNVSNLDYVGSSQKKIIDAYELVERSMLYLDINARLSADKALITSNQKGGFTSRQDEDTKKEYPCGIIVYPLINEGQETDKCAPSYYEALKEEFLNEFKKATYVYPELPLYSYSYDAIISKSSNDLQLKIFSTSPLKIPIYSDAAAYYDPQQISQKTSSILPGTFVDTPEGYKKTSGYSSLSRGSSVVDTIVIHYTAGSTVQSALAALSAAGLSYHYIIDKDGIIYQLVEEDESAQHAGCYRNGKKLVGCTEGYNSRSIGISLVNLGWDTKNRNVQCTDIAGQCWDVYTDNQMKSLAKLLVDIQERQIQKRNNLNLNETTIIYHSDIYSGKQDPGPAFDKTELLTLVQALKQKTGQTPPETTNAQNNSNQQAQATTVIKDQKVTEQEAAQLHAAVNYEAVKNKKPTFSVVPTVYYTAVYEDTQNWCSPTKGECFTSKSQIGDFYKDASSKQSCLNRGGGFCCIDRSDRGFYEDTLCQGSGVYANQLYKYNTIATTQSASTSINGYIRGQTATGTDPIRQWTVAVNTNPKSNCYVQYNTLMYVYFGEGNPWNGVYRAEDTGSAFEGQCKMDFYAGVGVAELNDAAKYVDPSKSAQIFFLDQNLNYVPSGTLASSGVSAQTGEITASYTFTYLLKGASEVYDLTQKFVKNTISVCSKRPYEEKQECLDEQIIAAKINNLNVNRLCLESGFLPAINLTDLEKTYTPWNTIIKVAGQIDRKEPQQMTTTTVKDKEQGTSTLTSQGYLYITQIPSNEPLVLKFPDKDALPEGFDWTTFIAQDYVEFSYLRVLSVDKNKNEITVKAFDLLKEKNKQAEDIKINPSYFLREIMKGAALNLAECSTSKQDECKCNVAIWALFENITFADGKISLTNMSDDNYVELSLKIYEQNEEIKNNIINSSNKDFTKQLKYTDLRFKKNKDGSLTYVNEDSEPDLAICVPENKYYLMCTDKNEISAQATTVQTGVSVIDDEALRFSIKI